MADENIYDEIEIEVSVSHQEKKTPLPTVPQRLPPPSQNKK